MEYVSIKELAEQLNTTKAKINYSIKKNGIEVKQIDNKHYVSVSDIDTISSTIKPTSKNQEEKTTDNPNIIQELFKANESQLKLYEEMLTRYKDDIERLTNEIERKELRIKDLEQKNSDLLELLTEKAKRPLLPFFRSKR